MLLDIAFEEIFTKLAERIRWIQNLIEVQSVKDDERSDINS